MEITLTLLKDWEHAGQSFKAGQSISIDSKKLAGELVVDGIAKMADEASVVEKKSDGKLEKKANDSNVELDLEKTITDSVEKTITSKMDEISKNTAEKIHDMQTKDLSDDDPTHGYLPPKLNGKSYSQDELMYGFGIFANEVKSAGDNMQNAPERLKKSIERSNMLVQKAAGDGIVSHTDSSLGSIIAPEFNSMLLTAAQETSQIRPRATIVPMSGKEVNLPQLNDYDRSDSTIYGGSRCYFTGEEKQLTESKPTSETLEIRLHKMTVLTYSSDEMDTFAPFDMGGFLVPLMGSAITFKEEDVFVNGTGAGMPLGILNSNALVSITAETGQTNTTNTIVTANIDNMEARLRKKNGSSVVWMYNRPELFIYLRDLKRTVGTGGEMSKIFNFGGFAATSTSNLDGIPILDSEHMPAKGTKGDLTLTDWSQYLIADHRRGAQVAQSMHLKFDYAQTAWRIIKYVGGQPMNSQAFTRHKGAQTTSSILAVATRGA